MGIARKQPEQASDRCECGHVREAHEHYRRGTECAICDIRQCSSFSLATISEYSRTP